MSDNWGRQELEASVIAYIEMLKKDARGEKYTKTSYYKDLSDKFGRTSKAYEYRMQNISYVYDLQGRPWLKGLKPLKNVGANVVEQIQELVDINDPFDLELKNGTSLENERKKFDAIVAAKIKTPPKNKPKGSRNPSKKSQSSEQILRDPEVHVWVLYNSKWICECCDKPAPFSKLDGSKYLEVHHVKRLVDGGSDTIENAIAVCPNCHRELHYGESRENLVNSLYSKTKRLIRE